MPNEGNQRVVLITGPSGAGRSTAVNALEDIGFEAIDNLPLSLLDRLFDGRPFDQPLALGLDVRNRDFAVDRVIWTIDQYGRDGRFDLQVLYIDASEDVLVRRYSETRRRHPLAPQDAPLAGIQLEMALLVPIRARADVLIDSTEMTPHDLRAEIGRMFGSAEGRELTVTVQSFSYKRGLPRGADMVFDCRFLRNPHWDAALRRQDGRAEAVADYIAQDDRYAAFFERVFSLTELLLPAYREEGKSHLSIAFGCTGGQHRSVALAEKLAKALAEQGWQVSKRHRELERHADAARASTGKD